MTCQQWLQQTIAAEINEKGEVSDCTKKTIKLVESRGLAFDAYVAKLAQIQEELSELQARSDDHFGNDPDSIHWRHVGDLDNILASLQLANGKAE